MDKELQEYYEARFSMCSEKGWNDLMEDIDKIIEACDDISTVTDEKMLNFRKGELSILRWIRGLKEMSASAYDELKGDTN